MTCSQCEERAIARGMCRRHYRNWWYSTGKGRCKVGDCPKWARPGGLCYRHSNGSRESQQRKERKWNLTERTLDHLAVDGGWLTAAGVAVALGCVTDTAERALRQLRREGLVESRSVALAYSQHSNTESRQEWKAV